MFLKPTLLKLFVHAWRRQAWTKSWTKKVGLVGWLLCSPLPVLGGAFLFLLFPHIVAGRSLAFATPSRPRARPLGRSLVDGAELVLLALHEPVRHPPHELPQLRMLLPGLRHGVPTMQPVWRQEANPAQPSACLLPLAGSQPPAHPKVEVRSGILYDFVFEFRILVKAFAAPSKRERDPNTTKAEPRR